MPCWWGALNTLVYKCYGTLYYCKSFFTAQSHNTHFSCNIRNTTLGCANAMHSVTSYACILG
jgi:hypothetical protein